jgi:hypothetical protein
MMSKAGHAALWDDPVRFNERRRHSANVRSWRPFPEPPSSLLCQD